MSSNSTSSLSETSDFVENSQAQSSTVSSKGHGEIKRKVYMRKKDRKASFAQQNVNSDTPDDRKENSDSDSSPTISSLSKSSSLKTSTSSYGSSYSTESSEISSPISSDATSFTDRKSSNFPSDSSYISSEETEDQVHQNESSVNEL